VYRSTDPPQQAGRATRPGSLSQQLLAYGTCTAPPTRRSRREEQLDPASLSQQLLAYGTLTAPPTRRSGREEQLDPAH